MSARSPMDSESKQPYRVEVWGMMIAGAGFGLIGVVAGLSLVWSLASCFCGNGLMLLLKGTRETSRLNRFGAAIIAWLVPSGLAVIGFMDRMALSASSPLVTNVWMICAGVAALLFIAVRVTANRTGEESLPTSLLRELFVLTLIVAFAAVSSQGQPSVPVSVAAMSVRFWSVGIALEGVLRLVMGELSGRKMSSSLSTTFLLRQLITGTTIASCTRLDDCDGPADAGRVHRAGERSMRARSSVAFWQPSL